MSHNVYLEDMTPAELQKRIEEVNSLLIDDKATVRNISMRNIAYMYMMGLRSEKERVLNGTPMQDEEDDEWKEWMKKKFMGDDDQ